MGESSSINLESFVMVMMIFFGTTFFSKVDREGKATFRPPAGITLILINTKNTRRNIMTSIMGITSILAFFTVNSGNVVIDSGAVITGGMTVYSGMVKTFAKIIVRAFTRKLIL